MSPSELLAELHEASRRLQRHLDDLNLRLTQFTAEDYWRLRQLEKEIEKDREEEKRGDTR
jgi:hypothetical protein